MEESDWESAPTGLPTPRAHSSAGVTWATVGLNKHGKASFGPGTAGVAASATVEMVKLMGELHGFSSRQALSLASLVVDLRITQMVNGIRGVHVLLRDDSIEQGK